MSVDVMSPLPLDGRALPDFSLDSSVPSCDVPVHSPDVVHPPVDVWEEEAMRLGFADEIKNNIEQFSASLVQRKDVDQRFLEILQKDIDMLTRVYYKRHVAQDSHVWSQLSTLNIRLQELATKLLRLGGDALNKRSPSDSNKWSLPSFRDIKIPLVGKIDSPLCLKTDNKNSLNKELQMLEEGGYKIRRVRGNGHCLFSSVAAHLMTEERLSSLKARLPSMKAQGFLGDSNPEALINASMKKLQEGMSGEGVLQDKPTYTAWVSFLRKLASNWWFREIDRDPAIKQRLAISVRDDMQRRSISKLSGVNDDDTEICTAYLKRIASMDAKLYGGDHEIAGLQETLGIRIRTVDAELLGKATSAEEKEKILPRAIDLDEMLLLFRGLHFDSLYLPEQMPVPVNRIG